MCIRDRGRRHRTHLLLRHSLCPWTQSWAVPGNYQKSPHQRCTGEGWKQASSSQLRHQGDTGKLCRKLYLEGDPERHPIHLQCKPSQAIPYNLCRRKSSEEYRAQGGRLILCRHQYLRRRHPWIDKFSPGLKIEHFSKKEQRIIPSALFDTSITFAAQFHSPAWVYTENSPETSIF